LLGERAAGLEVVEGDEAALVMQPVVHAEEASAALDAAIGVGNLPLDRCAAIATMVSDAFNRQSRHRRDPRWKLALENGLRLSGSGPRSARPAR
jgi:hypothetical protein